MTGPSFHNELQIYSNSMNEWMNEWMDTYIFEYDDMQCFILINKYNKTQQNFYHYTQG